jgi:hypothetical protein
MAAKVRFYSTENMTPESMPRAASLRCGCVLQIHGNGRRYETLYCPHHAKQDVLSIRSLKKQPIGGRIDLTPWAKKR